MAGTRVDRRAFLALGTMGTVCAATGLATGSASARRPAGPGAGEFVRIYDPSVGETEPWYINDHCLIQAEADDWHLFGITHPEPGDPEDEHLFAHATAPNPRGPWVKQPMALSLDPAYGETHLWAPHIVRHEDTYHMFYAGGGQDPTRTAINLATSTDLFHWTRHPGGTLFHDGYQARDPHVVQLGGQWVCYYTATETPDGGRHVVAYRTSEDLITWSERIIAFRSDKTGGAGDTESPLLVHHGGDYYLFIGPCGAYDDTPEGYTCTAVYRSPNPFQFPRENRVSKIPAHAPEVVREADDRWWITHCGWEQGGVYLAPLTWHD